MESTKLLRILRVVNIIDGILIGLAGFMAIFNLVTFQPLLTILGIYTMVFGLMLLCFECRFSSVEEKIRGNFGFLFSFNGRAAFIMFIGFICFSLDKLGVVVGILTEINGLFNWIVIKLHPDFRSGKLSSSDDPTALYTHGDVEAQRAAQQYVTEHPDVAMKAVQGATNFAAQNPQLVVAAASGSATNNSAPRPPPRPASSENPFM